MRTPIRIAVTGAAGQIGYSILFRLATGDLFGPEQPVILQLLDIPAMEKPLKGVIYELQDCAFPLLWGVEVSFDPYRAFADADLVFLIGAKPRGPGMERKDLLTQNARIFAEQGRALNAVAKRDARILVVGNPVNTNCLIAIHNAPDLDPRNFAAMTRLDHNRAVTFLAEKCGVRVTEVRRVAIWGNHSSTQFPDLFHAEVRDRKALEWVNFAWYEREFIPKVQQRGVEIIKLRGKSSAASAASAAIDHMRSLLFGTPNGDWTSMAVLSEGEYGVAPDLVFSYPVTCQRGHYRLVEGLELTPFAREKLKITERELLEERDIVRHLLQ